ncbi:endonuclease domain-containing protein [Sphingomonas sp. Root241]|uniref:endonuclease domain-containing protein n=1 Tax=Sphingomonas sp. Root241 TaxID=1736501 RepID=UPI0006FFB57D|nr:endonuclease domain-containing protein [Sphingomonas sp. Root241]KRC80316.1 DNA methylase [Sphingomonas sp. Root241]
MRTPVRRQTSRHASRLRKEATDAERLLWGILRSRRLVGHKFRFQAPIEPFVVDFLCVEARLIIEVDGSQHNAETDARRTQFLQSRGYRILRFWNSEVLENLDDVLEVISAALAANKRG